MHGAEQTQQTHAWHALDPAEAAGALGSNPETGLDPTEAAERLSRCGPNRITAAPKASALSRFLQQLKAPLVVILLVAAAISGSLGEWVDASVILGVVLVNAVIGFVQEDRALKAIEALSDMAAPTARVVRGGERRLIGAEELVPGDIVLLAAGDKVPADMRLLHTRELQVDEAILTGESVPVPKSTDALAPETELAERANMAWATTLVTRGAGRGIVTATGHATQVGRISELLSATEALDTPLTAKIARFSQLLLYIILAMAGVTFIAGLAQGASWQSMFIASVALAVGAIPEGLPAAVTITLAIGVARMARRGAIIRKLPAVETLGSTTVICSDKTGTLTRNEMTVQALWAGGAHFSLTGVGYRPEGRLLLGDRAVEASAFPALRELLTAGLLCNEAELVCANGTWRIEGDPTEGALIVAARKAGLDLRVIESAHPRLDTIPFESELQYMASLHALAGGPCEGAQREEPGAGPASRAYIKGSLEALLPHCTAMLDSAGRPVPIAKARILAEAETFAAQGLRVLAFARADFPGIKPAITPDDVARGLVFLGLTGMIDPPREEAREAVRACKSAGIEVKMITGDHAGTAAAVARALGLRGDAEAEGSGPPDIVTGPELAARSAPEVADLVARSAVFARIVPEQKLRLVEALQAGGEIVAMTGDGVNDAPALRRADIGIAMGRAGTDVTKEAADMVLTDDNFATIVAAVEEGRGVFDNLVKFITWTLPTNIGEGLVIMVAVLAGATLPILPVQILWINMTTAVLLGLMLAFEPKEPGIMTRPPRAPKAPLLSGALIFRIFSVGVLLLAGAFGLFEATMARGASVEEARTVALNVFVTGQAFYLLNCRSLSRSMLTVGVFSNRWVLGGIALMMMLQLLITYWPVMQVLFHTAPIGANDWLAIVGWGLVIYTVIGLEKWVRRRVQARRTPTRQAGSRSLNGA